MSLWTSSSKEDEPPKPPSLFSFHALCMQQKQTASCQVGREEVAHLSPASHAPVLSSAWSWGAQRHFCERCPCSPGLGQGRAAGSKEVVQTFIGVFMSSD